MKSIASSLNRRLTAYAAAGVALTASAASPKAKADIIYSGPLTLAIPQNSAGIYLNFLNGVTGTSSGAVPGYDFAPYLGNAGLSFFFNGTATTGNAGLTDASAIYRVLAPGASISSAAIYGTSGSPANMANYRAGETGGYLGVHFTNETTGATNYGWLQLTTSAGTSTTQGYPATILGYAYDNTGASILAGQTAVPEPGTTAAVGLGALALGAVGVSRWRRNKRAIA